MRFMLLGLAVVGCGNDTLVQPDAGSGSPDATPDATPCGAMREPDPDPAIDELLDDLEQLMEMENIPGLAFATLHGDTVRRFALGKREYGSCEPFTPATRIRLGRPARTLVNLATLVAIEDQRVTLDAPVTTYVPGFHVTGGTADVTIRHLLERTAGIYVPGFMSQCPGQDLVAYWSSVDARLEHAPGAAVGNYDEELSLLGAVLARVYAKPYREVIGEKIFAPLGMTATYDHDEFLLGEYARGGTQLIDPAPCGVWEPVHQVYASLDDLVALTRFLAAPTSSTIAIDLDLVRNAGARHHTAEFGIGYGLEHMPYDTDGTRMYFTDGWIGYSGAEIDIFADGFALAMVENNGHCTYCITDTLIEAFSSHAFANPLVPLPVARWAEYAGTWVDETSQPPRTLSIAVQDEKLTGTYGSLQFEYLPFGEDSFEVKLFGTFDRVRFWRDENGQPTLATSQFGTLGPAFHRAP